jgi:hypothetical protein
MPGYVYLHGFASSPQSSKAQYFRTQMAGRGLDLVIPALDEGDFEHLTLSRQLGVVERAVGSERCILFGSSMGGYLAALYAQSHAEVERVVLLAPAFDFARRWAERLGPEQMELWKRQGWMNVFHYGEGRERQVGYELFEDALQYPAYPEVKQPALVLHGVRDDVVPPERSKRFAEMRPNATLRFFESGHELTNVTAEMWRESEQFLFA